MLEVPSDYRSQIFPITASGDPLLVTVNVTILAFPEIHTLELSYTVDFVLLMQWIDPRLALNQIAKLKGILENKIKKFLGCSSTT